VSEKIHRSSIIIVTVVRRSWWSG